LFFCCVLYEVENTRCHAKEEKRVNENETLKEAVINGHAWATERSEEVPGGRRIP